MDNIADSIVQIFQFSPAQARNAYSATLLLPDIAPGLRFHPLLTPYKREWNQNTEKYASFWDALPLLRHLLATPPEVLYQNISLLRTQLILCCRLLCLYRSNDLQNLKREVSVINQVPYIKIKRKGQRSFKWERVVCIPEHPQISPFHLIKEYVARTRKQGKPGGPLLLSLQAPWRPLSSDTVAIVTKRAMKLFGIPSHIWGAHSTRGAGVGLMRKLGLSADDVCEKGKWKIVGAFFAHYQRLGAQKIMEEKLNDTSGSALPPGEVLLCTPTVAKARFNFCSRISWGPIR